VTTASTKFLVTASAEAGVPI